MSHGQSIGSQDWILLLNLHHFKASTRNTENSENVLLGYKHLNLQWQFLCQLNVIVSVHIEMHITIESILNAHLNAISIYHTVLGHHWVS